MVVAAALQEAWPQYAFIWDTKPELLLVLAANIGLARGAAQGLAAGFFAGLFSASLAGSGMGSYLLTRMLAGYVAGVLRRRLFTERLRVAAFVCAGTTLTAEVLRMIMAPPLDALQWVRSLSVVVLFSFVLGPLVYFPVRAIARQWPHRAEE